MGEWFVRLFIRDFTPTWFAWVCTAAALCGCGYVLLHFLLKYW